MIEARRGPGMDVPDDPAVRPEPPQRPVDQAVPVSVYVNDHPDGMLIEAVAGLLDADDPETAIRREASEELGVTVGELTHVFDVNTRLCGPR